MLQPTVALLHGEDPALRVLLEEDPETDVLLLLVLCTVYCVLCTVYCVLCTVYCVLCTVYCVLCTEYCVLCTEYCVLCTVLRSMLFQRPGGCRSFIPVDYSRLRTVRWLSP